ncbi:MAG: NAD(P)H-hydrate dehydratase [Clostridia bacterium]|nr:NAD(P)H-hydrate dehydratase [Clostridia bacterium]
MGDKMTEIFVDDIIPLLLKRTDKTNKGDFGKLLSFVGSDRYRGAAVLSSLGALRCGVGILRVCCNEQVAQAVVFASPEATLLPLGEKNFDISKERMNRILDYACPTAVLCGCGISEDEKAKDTVFNLISVCNAPVLLDASALNIVSENTEILKKANCEIIVTPHMGEFSRLTHRSIDEIKADREKIVADFASEHGVCVVLKDWFTLIATPQGDIFRSSYGNSGLSRGGSGDILSGMIASFLAQGLGACNSAKCGVVLHGHSADLCARRLSATAMQPHEILTDLSDIFLRYGL